MKTQRRLFTESVFALILALSIVAPGNAQNSGSPTPATDRNLSSAGETEIGTNEDETPAASKPKRYDYLRSFEFIVSIMILGISLVALAMEFFLLRKIPNLKAEDALRVFAVTLIIVGTLFFIAAGFDAKQVAPGMGLFGTVAGYLLGRSIDRKEVKDD